MEKAQTKSEKSKPIKKSKATKSKTDKKQAPRPREEVLSDLKPTL